MNRKTFYRNTISGVPMYRNFEFNVVVAVNNRSLVWRNSRVIFAVWYHVQNLRLIVLVVVKVFAVRFTIRFSTLDIRHCGAYAKNDCRLTRNEFVRDDWWYNDDDDSAHSIFLWTRTYARINYYKKLQTSNASHLRSLNSSRHNTEICQSSKRSVEFLACPFPAPYLRVREKDYHRELYSHM